MVDAGNPFRRIAAAVLLLAALAAAAAPLSAAAIERWYSRGLYPALQPVVTRASSVLPVALLDVAAGILILWTLGGVLARWRRHGPGAAVRWLGVWLLLGSAAIYLWFLLFWGLNYRRLPLEQKVVFDPSRVTREHALAFGRLAAERANALHAGSTPSPRDREALASAFAATEAALGARRYAVLAEPKRSAATWYFRQAAIDGMTNPFFLEIIVHPDLLPFERPFVLAHEWAHLAGYADESEANFVAWLACIGGSPATRYSGWLAAYEQMAGAVPREDRRVLRGLLNAEVARDLAAARLRVARANPLVSSAARGAYDTYLRANRIEEGIANYNAVVRLMLGTTFREGWIPELQR